jgi:hypothetical protein
VEKVRNMTNMLNQFSAYAPYAGISPDSTDYLFYACMILIVGGLFGLGFWSIQRIVSYFCGND